VVWTSKSNRSELNNKKGPAAMPGLLLWSQYATDSHEALDGVVARGGESIALHISRLLGGHRQQLGELIVANLGLRDQDATAQMLDQIGAD